MFDIEQLIEEVSERPALWDTKCPEYQIRKERNRAWEEICYVLFDEFETYDVSKKNVLCRSLQRRWKSLRDCYVRELHQNRHKNGKYYRRKYIFFNALSFLGSTIKAKPRKAKQELDPLCDDSMEEEESTSAEFAHEESRNETDSGPSEANHRSRLDDVPKKTTSEDQQPAIEEEDEDRLFLLSLVSDLKKIPEDIKLEAKSELLLVLNKWRKKANAAWAMERILND